MIRRLKKVYNYYFSSEREFVRNINELTGFTPANIHLFKQVFYHKSKSNPEACIKNQSNERLEFLGDAVLSTIIAEYLFKKYPDSNEGFLTKLRALVVKRKTLNAIASSMGLDTFLSNFNDVNLSTSMLGNALEALVGAIYIENGYSATKHYVISKLLMVYLDVDRLEKYDDNFKSQLLEWCQKEGNDVAYKVINHSKINKRDHFTIAVLIEGKEMGRAHDFSKKSAEQKASKVAINRLNITKDTNIAGSPVL